MVVFPAPVWPTSASVRPAGAVKFTSRNTHPSSGPRGPCDG